MKNVLLSLIAIAFTLFAQLDRGTITGTVTDPSGAAIPSAKLNILHVGSGARFEVQTNAEGQYSRPNLPIGNYELSVEAQGFRSYVRKGLTLGVTEVLRLDVRLDIGAVADAVEVTADVPKLNTDSPLIGTSLTAKSLTQLPLSFSGGRQPENFAYQITPGVSGGTFESHINGSTSFSKETLVDGASVTVNQGGDFSPMSVSVEALQEVKFQTGGMSAEFGRTQAGVFNYVMKSGTNQYHGSVYGGLRNEALNANTFANKARGVRRPQDRKINYAASFGGPVIIPKIYNGRNRTFFYTSHERYRERNYGFGSPNKSAPQPEFYQGDFSRLLGPATSFTDAMGRPVLRGAIYDPGTFRQVGSRWIGEMFPGNRIPVSRFSQVARNLNALAVKHYLPTIRDASGQIPLANNMVFPISGNPELDHFQYSVKVDHQLNGKQKLSGSWNFKDAPRFILDAGGLWDERELYGGPLAKTRRRPDTGWFSRIGHDWTVSPTVLNTLTLSYQRRGNPERILQADTDGAAALGIKGLSSFGYPVVNWGSGPFVPLDTPGFMNNSFRADGGAGIIDTVSFSKGKHFFKAGFDFRTNYQNRRQTPAGSFSFAARGTSIPNEAFSGTQTGYGFASYLLGIVDNAAWSDPVGLGARRRYFALFFQDDYKVSARLTLNLGLRWEYQPPLTEVKDRLSSWNLQKRDPASGLLGAYDFAGVCNECSGLSYFGRKSYKDFGPRVGFAYRVTNAWTLRGAYGIMYEGDVPNGYNASPLGKPTSVAWGGTYALAADPVNPWAGIFNWDNGFPNSKFQSAAFDVSWGNANRPGMIDPRYGQTPYIQNWNFNVQRTLPGRFALDVGYVGTKGTRLRVGELNRINQLDPKYLSQFGATLNSTINNAADAARLGVAYPYPGFRGTVAAALRPYPQMQGNQTLNVYGSPIGFSTYNALQITLNREYANGLTIYSNYVWSKNLSNVDSSLIGDNVGPLDYYNLGLEKAVSEYDQPHMFKAYVSYELPKLAGAHALLRHAIGGWGVAGIMNYYSGFPLAFTGSTPLNGGWNGASFRPNIAAGELRASSWNPSRFELSSANSPNNTYLNKSLFSDAPALTLGTAAKRYSQIRGFGTINENLTLYKSFQLLERLRFQLRGELLNVLNRHNFGGINTNVTNVNFGQVTTVSGNRQVQISGRFDF
jgi:hypothetical protein